MWWILIKNFRAASAVFKKDTFGNVLPRNILKQHYIWKKGTFCKILQGVASDYWTLISLGLLLVNSIETLTSQALIGLEISHEESKTIINEKDKYEKMKEIIRMTKSSDELTKEEGKKLTQLKCIKWKQKFLIV